jgi:hypothetical protein
MTSSAKRCEQLSKGVANSAPRLCARRQVRGDLSWVIRGQIKDRHKIRGWRREGAYANASPCAPQRPRKRGSTRSEMQELSTRVVVPQSPPASFHSITSSASASRVVTAVS